MQDYKNSFSGKCGDKAASVLAMFIDFLPWHFNLLFAKFLAFIWVDVFSIRKNVVFNNISIAFPNASDEDKARLMKLSILALARSFFDILRIPHLKQEWIRENVVIHGSNNVPKDKGCLILSLHLGSGDLAAAISSATFKPLSIITKRFKNKFVDSLWFSLRTRSQTEFIDAHAKNNAFEILKALKNKRGVAFVVDQFMGRPYGVETDFFGRKTGTAYGLALFAQKTKLPVIPLYTYWDDNNKLHIHYGEEVKIDDLIANKSLSQDELNVLITNRFNQTLENIIRSKPEQWMWVHRRWKDFE